MACASLLSELDIVRFRTKQCMRLSKGHCQFGEERCQYNHQRNCIRRCPFLAIDSNVLRYIPVICPEIKSFDDDSIVNCSNGCECPYAHCLDEVLYHPAAYKTVECAKYRSGKPCTYYCPFYHGLAEERKNRSYKIFWDSSNGAYSIPGITFEIKTNEASREILRNYLMEKKPNRKSHFNYSTLPVANFLNFEKELNILLGESEKYPKNSDTSKASSQFLSDDTLSSAGELFAGTPPICNDHIVLKSFSFAKVNPVNEHGHIVDGTESREDLKSRERSETFVEAINMLNESMPSLGFPEYPAVSSPPSCLITNSIYKSSSKGDKFCVSGSSSTNIPSCSDSDGCSSYGPQKTDLQGNMQDQWMDVHFPLLDEKKQNWKNISEHFRSILHNLRILELQESDYDFPVEAYDTILGQAEHCYRRIRFCGKHWRDRF